MRKYMAILAIQSVKAVRGKDGEDGDGKRQRGVALENEK